MALKELDTVAQGIGTFGIWRCVIVGIIFLIIGLILLIWGLTMDRSISAKICTGKSTPYNKGSETWYTHTGYEVENPFNNNICTSIEIPDSKSDLTTKTLLSVREKVGGDLVYSSNSKTILIIIGSIIGFIGIASGLFCYLMRNNVWFKRIMGIQTTISIGRSIFR